MKKNSINYKGSGLIMFAIMLLCTLFGVTGAETMFAVGAAPGAATALGSPEGEGGVSGEGIVTLDEALTESPTLVTRTIHNEVIKIAPYDYVTRSLLAQNFKQKKKTPDHKVVVYSAATDPIQVAVATAYTQSAVTQAAVDFGSVANKSIAVTETVYFPQIAGYKADGTTLDGHCLVCYVVGKESDGKPILKPRNGKAVTGVNTIPSLALATAALRGLRTGTETQIRTQPVNVLPTPTDYFIQKNIIEFGVSGWFDKATKEVRWDDRDLMEMALAEKIRTSMADFWLGTAGSAYFDTDYNEKEELAYFKEGLWTQPGREHDFNGSIDVDAIIDFGRILFTGNRSSNTKYFAMGSELSAAFQKVIFANPFMLGETYRDKELNINFTAINFFGGKKLLFADDPSLDDCGMSNCGFVTDLKYAFEYHYGMESIPIDNKKMQKADSKGQAIVEENCFILTNKDSHCRVIL